MKICPKCAVAQSDRRTSCIECGTRLGEPLGSAAEEKLRACEAEKLEQLYNKSDPLHVSVFDRVMGCIMAAELLAMVITAIASIGRAGWDFYMVTAFLLPLAGIIEAFFPKITWELEKLHMSFTANGTDDLTPSDYYFVMRRVGHCILAGLSAVFLAMFISMAVQPEIPQQPQLPDSAVVSVLVD